MGVGGYTKGFALLMCHGDSSMMPLSAAVHVCTSRLRQERGQWSYMSWHLHIERM